MDEAVYVLYLGRCCTSSGEPRAARVLALCRRRWERRVHTSAVVDDDPSVVHLLRVLVRLDAQFELAATDDNGAQALHGVAQVHPDAILCDVRMPVLSGMEALPGLRLACPQAVIAMYTSAPNDARGAVSARRGRRAREETRRRRRHRRPRTPHRATQDVSCPMNRGAGQQRRRSARPSDGDAHRGDG